MIITGDEPVQTSEHYSCYMLDVKDNQDQIHNMNVKTQSQEKLFQNPRSSLEGMQMMITAALQSSLEANGGREEE